MQEVIGSIPIFSTRPLLRGEFFDILEQKGKQHEKAEGMRGALR